MRVSWTRKSYTGKILAGFGGMVTAALTEAGQAGQSEARSRARVDTGAMQRATEYVVQGRELILKNDKDYAASNEFGNARGMSAQPFIRPGHDVMKDVFIERMKQGFKAMSAVR